MTWQIRRQYFDSGCILHLNMCMYTCMHACVYACIKECNSVCLHIYAYNTHQCIYFSTFPSRRNYFEMCCLSKFQYSRRMYLFLGSVTTLYSPSHVISLFSISRNVGLFFSYTLCLSTYLSTSYFLFSLHSLPLHFTSIIHH